MREMSVELIAGNAVTFVKDGVEVDTVQFPVNENPTANAAIFTDDHYSTDLDTILYLAEKDFSTRARLRWFDGDRFHGFFTPSA